MKMWATNDQFDVPAGRCGKIRRNPTFLAVVWPYVALTLTTNLALSFKSLTWELRPFPLDSAPPTWAIAPKGDPKCTVVFGSKGWSRRPRWPTGTDWCATKTFKTPKKNIINLLDIHKRMYPLYKQSKVKFRLATSNLSAVLNGVIRKKGWYTIEECQNSPNKICWMRSSLKSCTPVFAFD